MLHLKHKDEVISTVREGSRVRLPDGSFVMPARAGWTQGEYSIVDAPEAPAASPPTLEEVRAATTLPRAEFADRAADAGYITDDEAEAWAGGTAIPEWVADAIDEAIADGAIDASERRSVRIAVLTQERIGRTDRLIPILAQAANLNDEQVDALFGISGPGV